MDTSEPTADATPSPAGRRARLARVVLSRTGAAVLAVGVLTVGGVSAVAVDDDGQASSTGSQAAPRVLSPADGSLRVAAVTVPQMAGSCDGDSCYFVPQTSPVVVTAAAEPLPVDAGQSAFFNIAAHNTAAPAQAASIAYVDGKLHTAELAAGTYQVTMYGVPNGGAWQFQLVVPTA